MGNDERKLSTFAKIKLAALVTLIILALIVLSSSHTRCPINIFTLVVCKLPVSVVIIISALMGALGMAVVSRKWHRGK